MSTFLRYPDLVERQIVNNRTTLGRWIKSEGFPPGVLLGPNSRAWPANQVEAWLETRAAARNPAAKAEDNEAAEAEAQKGGDESEAEEEDEAA